MSTARLDSSRYRRLLEARLDPTAWIWNALQTCEADYRALALTALGDWSRLKIVAEDLFEAIANLQRPSWGHWNLLISSLREVRKSVLRTADPAQRERLERAAALAAILAWLDTRLPPEPSAGLRDLADYLRCDRPARPRVVTLFSLLITLRNRVAHSPPTTIDQWNVVVGLLKPLVEYLSSVASEIDSLIEGGGFPAPWFVDADSRTYAFNGFVSDVVVNYVDGGGGAPAKEQASRALDVYREFAQLLGRAEVQETAFRRLLNQLAPEERRGVLMGDYFVGRKIGEGGFATVHVGWQLSTDRKVAIKILHDGLDDDARRRFQQEARLLSELRHPNIVFVFGIYEETWQAPKQYSLDDEEWFRRFKDSAPKKIFIAMEWLEGRTLDDLFRSTDNFSDRTIAEWFRQTAEALQTVHNTGVIHRDVKPGNVMLTGDGQIKLMDFGIARSQREAMTIQTTVGTVWGTPAYMSPEQIRAVDAESELGFSVDIYALCATFYELFTRRRLYDHDKESTETVRTSKLQGVRPRRPRAIVAGLPWELETILLGGLEHEASDRYRTMAQLERDLRHYLNDEPIEYRRPSLVRRLQLGYRRNRRMTQVVGAFALAALIGLAIYIRDVGRERDEANRSFQNARTAVNDFFTEVGEEVLFEAPGMDELRRTLLAKTLDYHDRFIAQRGDVPELQEELGLTKFRIGRLTEKVASPAEALPHHQEAQRIQAKLHAESPADAARSVALGDTLNALGRVLHTMGRTDEAERALQESAAIRGSLAIAHPQQAEYARAHANALMNLGVVHQRRLDFAEAERLMEDGRQIRRARLKDAPNDWKFRRDLAMGDFNLAELQMQWLAADPKQGDVRRDKATKLFETTLKEFDELMRRNPADASVRLKLAQCYLRVGQRTRADNRDLKITCYETALDLASFLVELSPNVAEYVQTRALALMSLGALVDSPDDFRDAAAEFRRLVEIAPTDWRYRCDLARALREYGLRDGDAEKSKVSLDESRRLLDDLRRELPAEPQIEYERKLTAQAIAEPAGASGERPQ